jgi:cytochrome c553
MNVPVLAVIALAALAGCGRQDASTTAEGKTKFDSVCRDCHGDRGQGRGIYPRLAGRPADELATRLRQYKSGHKTSDMSDTMRPFAQALSEREIDQLAAYLAAQ